MKVKISYIAEWLLNRRDHIRKEKIQAEKDKNNTLFLMLRGQEQEVELYISKLIKVEEEQIRNRNYGD